MVETTHTRPTARWVVAQTLTEAASRFPDLDRSVLDTSALDAREARLAVAIHRCALQRWITIEYLLNLHLKRPVRRLDPDVLSVLISGGAQVLFMDRLPHHAVVDESVAVARRMAGPGAAKLVNAVLRRLCEMVAQPLCKDPWEPTQDRLPLDGGYVKLRDAALPDPNTEWVSYLAVVTSHPRELVSRWSKAYERDAIREICLHAVLNPPTIVAMEDVAASEGDEAPSPLWGRHQEPDFVVWRGGYRELVGFLKDDPVRRVQDPTSAKPVMATAGISPCCCVDYCAGRGTKTRQLAMTHTKARIIATDADPGRLADLRQSLDQHHAVEVVGLDNVGGACGQECADLLVLDVPCTNTGVLGRRPEARYRFSNQTLSSLVTLQRRIVERAMGLVRPGGHVLYSTCSLEQEENQHQVAWIEQRYGATVIQQSTTLPDGSDTTHHDGGYYALLACKT